MILHLLLIFLALFGFGLSLYIRRKKSSGKPMVCPLKSDCHAVISSQHSKFFGIPVEMIGLAYYATIAIAYTFFLVTPFNANSLIVFLILLASTAAVFFSLYLTSIQIFTLRQWCFWCLTSASICVAIFILAISGSGFGFVPLLAEYYHIFVIFHVLGVALGLGGVIIVDILFYKFLEDGTISKWESDLMRTLSQVIWFALGILIITGLCFYLVNWQELNHRPKFLVKMIVVLVITVNGALLNFLVAPNLTNILFNEKDNLVVGNFHRTRKLAFALGAISMTSWLSAFVLGMLRGVTLGFWPILSIYIGALLVAVITSQVMEKYFTK